MSLLVLFAAAADAPALPAFLTGCWERVEAEAWTQECWMEPKAGLMLGASREGKGAKLGIWEWMRIEQAADGAITFYASPRGAPPASFPARTVNAEAIEFVNAAHDYPQRIRYWIKDGQLEAEISKIDGSDPVRWSYRREGGN